MAKKVFFLVKHYHRIVCATDTVEIFPIDTKHFQPFEFTASSKLSLQTHTHTLSQAWINI